MLHGETHFERCEVSDLEQIVQTERWEYTYVESERGSDGHLRVRARDGRSESTPFGSEILPQYANSLGNEGWELVSVIPTGSSNARVMHTFKRRKGA